MYDDLREFFTDQKNNPDYVVICFIVCLLIAGAAYWLYADSHRDDGIHNDVNGTLERIETGIDDAGKRVDSIAERVSTAEEAVGGAASAVTESRKSADDIANGIADCEKRIDNLIQGTGRIKNLINDIETANRQGAAGASAAGVAK